MVVDDLMVTGRVRFEYLKGMSHGAQFGSNQRSGAACLHRGRVVTFPTS